MQEAWKEEAAATFLRRLRETRAQEFMQNTATLRHLRHDPETARRMQKWFGSIWANSFGTDIYKLIAKACGETWDFEDEEKHASVRETAKKATPLNKARHDDLAAAREEGARRGQYQLQGIVEESECLLEEEQGRLGIRCIGTEEEETARQKGRRRRRGRGADFYRRAGGST